MSRQAEKINFADEYTRQVNDKTYESSIRKAEISKACLDAIDWADRTMPICMRVFLAIIWLRT